MRWKLCSSVWACGWRRLRPVLVANPLLAVLCLAALAAVPLGALAGGRRLAAPFAAAVEVEPFAVSLALGVGAAGAVAGAAVAVLLPDPAGLARELEAAPVRRRTLALWGTAAPTGAVALAASVPLLLFGWSLAGTAAVPLVLAAAAAVALGAALGEGAKLLAQRDAAAPAVLAGVVLVWIAGGVVSEAGAEVGPAGPVAGALTAGSAVEASLWLLGLTSVSAALWVVAAARPRRPPVVRHSLRGPLPLPRRALPAAAAATWRRLLRHRRLRVHAAATVCVPVAAAAGLGAWLGVGGAALVAFCGGLALPAAAVFPPAARGLDAAARWLLAAAPRRGMALAAAGLAAGATLAVGLAAACVIGLAPLARADAATYVQLEAAAAFVAGAAALAAGLVSWDPDRVLQQLASYGAVVASALALWLLVGRLRVPAEAVGLAGPAFGAVAGNAVLAGGVAAGALLAR